MELFRALAVLAEPPDEEVARVAAALELGPLPTADEYTELFVLQLYPYASVYLGAEGMLGGEARDRISGFWRALSPAKMPPAESDHLALMLALYARLCELAGDESDESDEKGRGAWERARRAFLWEHLLCWLPVYLHKLDALAPPFYRRWGKVLRETLLSEAKVVGGVEALPLHLRAAPALVDPRAGASAGEFIQSLLSPVRSGMILTRSDLNRAARRLGLGTRLGERAFILRALLGQNAGRMLEWLAEEALGWAERHRADANSLGAVARAWEEKARAAALLLGELKAEAGEIVSAVGADD
jgi:TorA maturation chaperone TorD